VGREPQELWEEIVFQDLIPEEKEYVLSGDGLHPFKKRADPKSDRYAVLGGSLSINHIKRMLKASYKGHSIGIGVKGDESPPEKIDDFILDKELSGPYAVVYYNPISGQAVVAHRGTEGTLKDWSNNLMYAVGKYKSTKRYQEGLRTQKLAEKKYGAKNISTIGHSQGSALARELGKDTKEIITLNPAYKGEKPLKNEYNIRSSRDIVSAGLWGTKRSHDLIIPAKGLNLLDEHMIDILDRVDQNKMIGV
jgi:hypothetical protein